MIGWLELERAAQQAGWKRTGRTWRGGPCPSCGGGTRDTAWVAPGRRSEFIGGCNGGCTGPDVARALVPSPVVWRGPRTRNAHAPRETPPTLPERAWRATEPVEHTPGATYLTARGLAGPWPVSVRWLPTESARRVGLQPSLPAGAAGCLVYRFASPGEADTHAAQLEAVNTAGARVLFATAGKRPSVRGSTFAHGARVFHAGGDADRGVQLCEGPLDALALMHLEQLGAVELAGGAVHGAPGVSGFQLAACPGRGPVTLWPDADGAGIRAALRLRLALEAAGRRCAVRLAGDLGDVADWAAHTRRKKWSTEDTRKVN